MIERAQRAASDLEYEHRLLMPNQSVKYLHFVARGAHDQEGRLEYIGAVQDVPAPLIYTSATLVAARVPEMFLVSQAQITVTFEGRPSAPLPVQVVGSSPGVFTLDASGKGQAVALNQNSSLNTASNPAKVGDVISLYVTGCARVADPITVTIGDGQVSVTSTQNLSSGVLQIDAKIPVGNPNRRRRAGGRNGAEHIQPGGRDSRGSVVLRIRRCRGRAVSKTGSPPTMLGIRRALLVFHAST
jgi:hypothetical protein